MFGWLKRGKEPTEAELEAWDTAKQEALERVLGPMHDTVLHSIIPFFLGGGLDLYPFPNFIPGTVYVTQELIGMSKKGRPRQSRIGFYELAAATRARPDPALEAAEPKVVETVRDGPVTLIRDLLNPISHYAQMAKLNPGETAEIPADEGEPNQCVIFDELDTRGKPFEVQGERFGLLLCIRIHPTELAYARANGGQALLAKLRTAGVYPYSDLDRAPVA